MVRNNYEAMQWIKTQLGKPFSLQMLLELQAMLTLGTNPESERGRLRDHAETVRVATDHDDETIHTPPPADQLPTRIEWLCEYANATDDGRNFVHPLVKACILHFMIGFDHPFPDGNGRTARAVFYWYALKHGYDIFEYLTISEIIRRGPSKYVQAFVDCESDEGDLTYFILYKLDVIHRALKEFEKHVQHEEHRLERAKSLVRLSKSFNIRQRLLLEHALRHPDTRYTVKSHATSNDISLPSARKDLDGLAAKRFFVKSSRDKEAVYEAAPGLGEKLEKYIKD
jgi:Fic family protein